MITLALDVGDKRIGVAVSDDLGLLASPHSVIQRRSTAQAIDAIVRLVAETGAGLVVVGLPVSFDGALHAQAQSVQRFGGRLRARLGVPIVYSDESLSTVRAEERLRAAGVRPQKLRERIDAAAAAVILEDYLRERAAHEAAGQGPAEERNDPASARVETDMEAEERGT